MGAPLSRACSGVISPSSTFSTRSSLNFMNLCNPEGKVRHVLAALEALH
jgi:hypothetical protein